VSESLDIKKNAIVEKKSQTVKLPSVTIRSLGFKNLVLRKVLFILIFVYPFSFSNEAMSSLISITF